ncbi:hypothetical protein AGIG_G18272 [Arapaima gigas]
MSACPGSSCPSPYAWSTIWDHVWGTPAVQQRVWNPCAVDAASEPLTERQQSDVDTGALPEVSSLPLTFGAEEDICQLGIRLVELELMAFIEEGFDPASTSTYQFLSTLQYEIWQEMWRKKISS